MTILKYKISIIIVVSAIVFSVVRSLVNCSGSDEETKVETVKPLPPIDKGLQHRIDSFVSSTQYIGEMGMMVYDITAEQEVFSYNPDNLMRPASCMKLLTCITALRKFGTNATHKTRLYVSGHTEADTLVGNIILKMQFDPFFNRDSLYNLVSVLSQPTPFGRTAISHLKGRVIIDMNNPQPMDHEMHWIPGDLRTRYLGLAFTGYKKMVTEMQYALSAKTGIKVVRDSIVAGTFNPRKAHLIGTINTPLHSSIERALRVSSNINAECMLYPLGYLTDRRGHYRENGIEALKSFISTELNQDPAAVSVIHDGCGLCPDDKMSPRLLISLLIYASKHHYMYRILEQDLPHSGNDGTLHDRLYKPHVKGRIWAKTGTLTREGGISTLAGYFIGDDGHLIAFAIMNNKCPVLDGRWWQDKMAERAFFKKMKIED